MVNWFSVHGTSMNNTNQLISGDNKVRIIKTSQTLSILLGLRFLLIRTKNESKCLSGNGPIRRSLRTKVTLNPSKPPSLSIPFLPNTFSSIVKTFFPPNFFFFFLLKIFFFFLPSVLPATFHPTPADPPAPTAPPATLSTAPVAETPRAVSGRVLALPILTAVKLLEKNNFSLLGIYMKMQRT